MLPFLRFFRTSRYAPLRTSDDSTKESIDCFLAEAQTKTYWSVFRVLLLVVISNALSMTVGLATGYLACMPKYTRPLGTAFIRASSKQRFDQSPQFRLGM